MKSWCVVHEGTEHVVRNATTWEEKNGVLTFYDGKEIIAKFKSWEAMIELHREFHDVKIPPFYDGKEVIAKSGPTTP